MIPPGIEPGTLSVLDSRDNHYTMESYMDLIDDTPVCIHVALLPLQIKCKAWKVQAKVSKQS